MNDLKANHTQESGAGGSLFLLIFGIVWCSLVGVFDWLIVSRVVQQVESTWFEATPARILKGEVTSSPGSEGGTTYGVAFEYVYAVGGTNYIGKSHTFDTSSSSDSKWAYQAVAAFPAGSERNCFYDPENPNRAVLVTGLRGSDVTQLMFITPFNIVALFFIAYPIWSWRDRMRGNYVAPRVIDRMRNREAYALNNFSPLMTFFAVFGAATFVGIFAVVFTGGFHPSMAKVLTIWGGGFALAVWAAASVYLKTKAGRYDLVFDRDSRTVTVPAVHKRTRAELIPLSEVKAFDVERVETGSGDDHTIKWQVKLRGNAGREFLLQEMSVEPQAKRLAETLNAKLNN